MADRDTPFTDEERALLEAIAHHAAVALEHGRAVMRGVLAQEIHHRVKNNLQTVASLLRLQARAEGVDPREALEHSVNRILAIAAVHESLTEQREEDVELAELIDRLRAMLVQGLGAGRDVQARLEPVSLAGSRATALALVFSELLQNALEHGAGTVRIELARRDGDVVLAIADEGSGTDGASSGTGLSIVRALVADELHGSFAFAAHARRGRVPGVRTQEVLIVVRRGDDFLVVHRSPENDAYWHQIAGGVEDGETFADAAVRELREETGLEAAVLPLDAPFRYESVHVESFIVDAPAELGADARLGARRVPLAAARGSRRAPLLARAGGPAAEPAVTELWHFSEDPSLGRSCPATARSGRSTTATAGSTGSRATARERASGPSRRRPTTTSRRWLDGDRDRRVAVIETAWLERVRLPGSTPTGCPRAVRHRRGRALLHRLGAGERDRARRAGRPARAPRGEAGIELASQPRSTRSGTG